MGEKAASWEVEAVTGGAVSSWDADAITSCSWPAGLPELGAAGFDTLPESDAMFTPDAELLLALWGELAGRAGSLNAR